MDELAVSALSSQTFAIAALLGLAAHLAAGFAVGVLYFLAIWLSARLVAEGGGRIAVVCLSAARIALLLGSLTLASLEGASSLLATALGALIGRAVVVRKMSELTA